MNSPEITAFPDHQPDDVVASKTHPPEAEEEKETEPSLRLTAAGPCNNSSGLYVGLNRNQRTTLGVEVGGTVEVFEGDRSRGVHTVGLGSTELLNSPEQFTINGVNPGTQLLLKKAAPQLENPILYTIQHGVEENGEHAKRSKIITERFQGSGDEYMVIPTPLLNTLTGGRGRVSAITRMQVRVSGTTHAMVLVPSGTGISFTTAAAIKLGIPEQLTDAQVRAENGVLIFN